MNLSLTHYIYDKCDGLMKRETILLKEEINRLVELGGRSIITGKHLVVVDIQPEYQSGFNQFIGEFIHWLNISFNKLDRLTFMFNGSNTVGEMNEDQYRHWWLENGLKGRVLDKAKFYDKGYAFFRYCMDEGIEQQEIISLVKFMMDNDIHDSRDLTEDFWNQFSEQYHGHNIRELMESAGDCIHIPDLMDELKYYNNIILCGGGINECLKEVEIALHVLGKPFNVLSKYTY